jgi:hypothetical protein
MKTIRNLSDLLNRIVNTIDEGYEYKIDGFSGNKDLITLDILSLKTYDRFEISIHNKGIDLSDQDDEGVTDE